MWVSYGVGHKSWCYITNRQGSELKDTAITIRRYNDNSGYYAEIFELKFVYGRKVCVKISDKDLELVKLKSLIKAKDIGWNVNSVA